MVVVKGWRDCWRFGWDEEWTSHELDLSTGSDELKVNGGGGGEQQFHTEMTTDSSRENLVDLRENCEKNKP